MPLDGWPLLLATKLYRRKFFKLLFQGAEKELRYITNIEIRFVLIDFYARAFSWNHRKLSKLQSLSILRFIKKLSRDGSQNSRDMRHRKFSIECFSKYQDPYQVKRRHFRSCTSLLPCQLRPVSSQATLNFVHRKGQNIRYRECGQFGTSAGYFWKHFEETNLYYRGLINTLSGETKFKNL